MQVALRLRAAGNGRSVEAEVRAIIEAAALPPARRQVGSALAHIGWVAGGVSLHPARDMPVDEPERDAPVDEPE